MKNRTLRLLKILILAAASIGFIPAAKAEIGLAAVVNASKARNVNAVRSYTSDSKISGGVALLLKSRLNSLGFESGAIYVNRKIAYGSLYTENANWIQIPVLGRLYLSNSVSLGLGAYAALAVGDAERETSTTTTEHTYESLGRKKLDFGWVVAATVDLPHSFIEARYNSGIRNLLKNTTVNELKYSDLQLLLGLRF